LKVLEKCVGLEVLLGKPAIEAVGLAGPFHKVLELTAIHCPRF